MPDRSPPYWYFYCRTEDAVCWSNDPARPVCLKCTTHPVVVLSEAEALQALVARGRREMR